MKYLAVISAVVLVGGYVFLKSGGGRAIMPSTKSGRIVNEPERDPLLMPGSKSSAPFIASDKDKNPSTTKRTMMSGSKSMSHVIDGENVLFGDGSTTQPATNPAK